MELTEIIDVQAVKPLMDDFYKLVHMPIGLNDLKGNVLAGVGWQDICTKFHRVNPETFKHCVESDTKLSSGVFPGEFKLYKCKNNMYDMVTPIIVGGQQVGYVFSGQFFFDDEPLDYELFRSQARKYGFNEEEYIAALERVPRLSREAVETGMSFFMTFANMLSQLNYSNVKLAKSLSERDTLLEALRESESKYRHIIETTREGVWIIDRDDRTVFVNQRFPEILGYSIDEIIGQTPQKFLSPEFRTVAGDRLREHRQRVRQAIDYRFIRKDGSDLWCIVSTHQLFDDEGNYAGSLGMLTDITERKKMEEALKKANDTLEEQVKERTAELERAYNSLKESEEKYRNIVETANEGIGIIDDKAIITYANRKMANMLGYTPEEGVGRPIWDFIDEDYKDIVKLNIEKRLLGINESRELKLICKDGSSIWALINSKALFDNHERYMGLVSLFTDITKRKEAERALANIDIARKKEIHHRIKNNLQVISSLLDLQAEKFRYKQDIEDSDVLEAFKESQDRVISMALIHEELHKGDELDTLDFSSYIEKLANNLFLTYKLGNVDISLNMDLEERIIFDIDTAVPLGMIINELVSNSFKHAFSGRNEGKIQIKLHREEKGEYKKSIKEDCNTTFILSISDNGVGIPENLNIEDLDTLGMQLVTSLVNQLDGELELIKDNGTAFIIRFTVTENND